MKSVLLKILNRSFYLPALLKTSLLVQRIFKISLELYKLCLNLELFKQKSILRPSLEDIQSKMSSALSIGRRNARTKAKRMSEFLTVYPLMKDLFLFKQKDQDSNRGSMSNLLKYKGLTLFLCVFAVSCIKPPQKRLAQTLLGTIVPVSQVTGLECLLTTGPAREERVNWTEAQKVNLERKSSGQYEKIKSRETISYKYRADSEEEKTSMGYINYFSYVSVDRIEESKKFHGESSSGSGNYQVTEEGQAVKTKNRLTCENLLHSEEIPFLIAKPDYTYIVRFQIVGNRVRALLLAPAEDLPSQALAYSYKTASRGEQEMYAMPFGGYKVYPGYIEQKENTDWEATNVLIFRKIPIRRRAEYQTTSLAGILSSWPSYYQKDEKGSMEPRSVVQVQFDSVFKPFKTLAEQGKKKDVYAKSFFSGDWYYTSTFITNSMSSHPQLVPGRSFSRDNHSWKSHKIRLHFEDKNLVAYTLNKETTEDENSQSTSDDRWIFKIPIKHLDYRTNSPLGELDAGLEEILDNTKREREKNYFQAQFSQIAVSNGSFPGYQLHEVTVSEDYLSFVLRSEVNKYQVRFSFLRPVPKEESAYSPLILSEASENFPAFFERKRVDLREKFTRSKEFQESITVKRFQPGEPIVYRFSTLTPEDPLVRNMGREMVALWAQIFEKAGVSCAGEPCVTLLADTKDDVELGDIRYNILNLISPHDLSGPNVLNGLGPSVADFETGKIISTTANVYLDQMHTSIIRHIYDYLQSRSGLIRPLFERNDFKGRGDIPVPPSGGKQSSLLKGGNILSFVPRFLRHWNPEMWSYNLGSDESMELVPFSGMTLKTAEGGYETVKFLFPEEDHFSEDTEESLVKLHEDSALGTNCELQSGGGFLPAGFRYRLIEALCGEHLTLLKEIENADITNQSPHKKRKWLWEISKTENYKEEIYQCADKVLKVVGLGTGIHELGHNMAMLHNFAASSDKSNFLPVDSFHYGYTFESDEQKEKVLSLLPSEGVTASVMDYMPSPGMKIVPGRYDIDFIRFLYKEEMETDTGQWVKVKVSNEGEVHYLTEAGEPVHQREIREYKTCWEKDLKDSADIYCNQWDRGTTPSEIVEYHRRYLMDRMDLYGSSLSPLTRVMAYSVRRFFKDTIKIYHKWRVELSKKLTDTADPLYLKDISAEEYRAQIENLLCEQEVMSAEEGETICGNKVVKNPELAELYKARSIIYKTFRDFLFEVRDHYCVLRNINKGGLDELVAFRDIHQYLMETDRSDLKRNFHEISSCDDVRALFSRNLRGYVGEIGIPLFPGVFSTHQNDSFDFHRMLLEGKKADYSGSIEGRLLSGLAFFGYKGSPVLEGRRLISLMNEPDIRKDIFQSLTSRILRGIYIGTMEESNEPVFQPVFSNEELLWRALALPIFMNYTHSTNSLDVMGNRVGSSVVVRPINLSKPDHLGSDFVQTGRVLKYERIRKQKGYMIHESKELYQRSGERPLILINRSRAPHLTALIQALRAIDLRKSFLHFTEKINQSDRGDSFQNKKDKVKSYMDDLVAAAKELYSDPSVFVNIFTFSLLYDYLELGEKGFLVPSGKILPNHGVMTDALVEHFQSVRTARFKIGKTLQQKCLELKRKDCIASGFRPYLIPITAQTGQCEEFRRNDCFISGFGPYLIPRIIQKKANFSKFVNEEINRVYEVQQMVDSAFFQEQDIETINIFKPVLESLPEYIAAFFLEHEKETFYFVHELYLMELFRSDRHNSSQVRRSLEELLAKMKSQVSLSEEERAEADQRVERVKQHIAQLRTLKDHANSKLFQEIFIRSMLFHSWKVDVVNSKGKNTLQSLSPILGMTSLLDMTTVLPVLPGEALQNVRERLIRIGLTHEQLFLSDQPLLGILQQFQTEASGILEKSLKDVLNTMRVAPSHPDNPMRGLEPFISASYLDESAPLYGIFNGRMFRELEAQKNIIIAAIRPLLFYGNEDDETGEEE